MFLFLILLLIALSGCHFSPKSSIRSTFKIIFIDSTQFYNYNIIQLISESGTEYILLSSKQCDLDSTEMINYRKININESIDISIIEYNKYPVLESSFRSVLNFNYYVTYLDENNQDNALFWSDGKYYKNVFYSPEICGLFLLKQ